MKAEQLQRILDQDAQWYFYTTDINQIDDPLYHLARELFVYIQEGDKMPPLPICKRGVTFEYTPYQQSRYMHEPLIGEYIINGDLPSRIRIFPEEPLSPIRIYRTLCQLNVVLA